MRTLFARWIIIFWLLFTISIALLLIVSPVIPRNIGAVGFQSMTRLGDHYYFYDHMTGLQLIATEPLDSMQLAMPDIVLEDGQQQLIIYNGNHAPQIVGNYPMQPLYEWAIWQDYARTIALIYTDATGTAVSLVDVATGNLSHLQAITDFYATHLDQSPDGRFIVLRQDTVRMPLVTTPQAHRVIDLQIGQIYPVPDTLYAHWSPNGQFLLIGQPTESGLQVTVEVYEIATGQRIDLGITAPQSRISIFHSEVTEGEIALQWSADSQSVMVFNDVSHELTHISRAGDMLHIYDEGRLFPNTWSPDSRLLTVTGRYQDQVGAFVLDTQTHTIQRFNSSRAIMPNLAQFAWSGDSQYIAVLTRTSGIHPLMQLTIYDRLGQHIAQPALTQLNANQLVYRESLRWINP